MATSLQKVCGFFVGAALTEASYKAHEAYKALSEDQQEHISEKISETARAYIRKKTMSPQTQNIHTKIVYSLSSKKFTDELDKRLYSTENYLQKQGIAYLLDTRPAFREGDYLVYEHQGLSNSFRFAGKASALSSANARQEIIKGNYQVCPSEYFLSASYPAIIVTGSQDCSLCDRFKSLVLKELRGEISMQEEWIDSATHV